MTRRSRQKRLTCLLTLILPVLGLLMVISLFTVGAASGIPDRAEQTFGPPAPHLSILHQYSYALMLVIQEKNLVTPAGSGPSLPFRIDSGESVPSITGRLYQDGLITNPGAFRTYLLYSGLDRSIQAGTYNLNPEMTSLEIAQALQDATPAVVALPILPGWRLEEIAAALPTSGLGITPDEFLDAAQTRPAGYSFSQYIPEPPSLEGFLLPGSYEFDRNIEASEVIRFLLNQFEEQVSSDIRAGFNRQGLNLYEAVTLASIIQREAVDDNEMPMIASVFLNRLEVGMRLDTDPTVQYALGYNQDQGTWWTNPLSFTDLQTDSPYNTYRVGGLPPTPIGSPSLAALRSVAFPAQTPYYYFRAGCQDQSRHNFAETYQQHLDNACP
jgi:UPF0755 protein